VVGVGVNLHGAGFPRVFIPSFLEGSPSSGMTDVSLKKFFQIAERVMGRRNIPLTESDRKIYERVFEVASSYK
ncbi:MAG: glucose-1-phosphate thymidylyltransferase, partial [Muribaculaceae bacterium]|nr:glucose-1-phosphate thymidylyltransferase [Muribaculaceae bacterium]